MIVKKSSIVWVVKAHIKDAVFWRRKTTWYKRQPAYNDMTHWTCGRYEQALFAAKQTAKLLKEGK